MAFGDRSEIFPCYLGKVLRLSSLLFAHGYCTYNLMGINGYLKGGRIPNAGKRAFLSVAMALMIGMLSVSGAYAWNEVQLQQLKTTNSCQFCDLRNADIRYVNLSGATWTDRSKCKVYSIGEYKR